MEMEASDVTGSISETLVSEPDPHEQSTPDQNPLNESNSDVENHESRSSINGSEIFRALEVVERDAIAIGESFTSLFSSLRLALSEVTSTSVEHMRCFNDAAGRLQESALDAATKGNRFINSCLRLNEEMKGIDDLSLQLKILRRNVDTLDSTVNRLLRFP